MSQEAFWLSVLCNIVADVIWVIVIWFMHSRQIRIIEDLFNPDTPGGMADALERMKQNGKTQEDH